MKTLKQKKNTGSHRGRPKKNSALSKLKLPELPNGIPDFPASIMKQGENYERTREIYSMIGFALVNYGALYQHVDSHLMLIASVNFQVWEDCLPVAIDPSQRILEEAKSHTAIDPETGKLPTVLKAHPALKIMKDAEDNFRNAMGALGLTVTKRASIMGTLSLYQDLHGNNRDKTDPFAKFFIAQEMGD